MPYTRRSAVLLRQGSSAYNKQTCWLKEPLFLCEGIKLFLYQILLNILMNSVQVTLLKLLLFLGGRRENEKKREGKKNYPTHWDMMRGDRGTCSEHNCACASPPTPSTLTYVRTAAAEEQHVCPPNPVSSPAPVPHLFYRALSHHG